MYKMVCTISSTVVRIYVLLGSMYADAIIYTVFCITSVLYCPVCTVKRAVHGIGLHVHAFVSKS